MCPSPPTEPTESWLILSHAFNMDGRAASHTLTDKIPFLLEAGVQPIVISAQTGAKDRLIEHHQLPSIAPSGLKFDLRHQLNQRVHSKRLRQTLKGLLTLPLLPFYAVERSLIHLDSHWSWFVTAYLRGKRLVREKKPRLIYSTGGANSAHYAGYLLARKTGLPWIAEVHDPMIHEDWRGSRMSYRWAAHLEGLICREAAAAWWFTEMALERARTRHPGLGKRGHLVLPGAEKPDFGDAHYLKRGQLHLSHFGSLHSTRNLQVFLEALKRVIDQQPEARHWVRVHTYGSALDPVSRASMDRLGLNGLVIEHGRVEQDPGTGKSGRQQVLEAMRTSDVLLLLHGTDPFCEEYIPSKTYEYLWTQRPILALTWRNALLDRILKSEGHQTIPADDIDGTAQALSRLLSEWQQSTAGLPDNQRGSPYTTRAATQQILKLTQTLATPPSYEPPCHP